MLLDGWRLAVGTLTAVRVAAPSVVDRRRASVAMVLAPVAVLPLGVAVTCVAVAGHGLGIPVMVVALLALAVAILGNRAFHLDGLADTVDGMAASYDAERSLTVMKSGTSGPAGVVAVVLVVGLQATALSAVLSLPHALGADLLAGCAICLSRAALSVCCGRRVPSARPDGLGGTYAGTVSWPRVAVQWILGAAVISLAADWAGLPWWRGTVAAALALGVSGVVVVHAVRRLGGVTGDVFGAAVELALVAVLVALS